MRIALWSHVVCALAFWALTLALLFRGRGGAMRLGLAGVAALTATWAAGVAASIQFGWSPVPGDFLEMVRTLALIGFSIVLIRRSFPAGGLGRIFEAVLLGLALVWAAVLFLPTALLGGQVFYLVRLAAAVFGLICLENLVRNTNPERRWSIKFGATGFGLILAYDLVLFVVSALYGQLDEDLWAARGIVDALAVPLILLSAARNPDLVINLHVSRQVVFHSATALVAGLAILLVAIGGYYIRATGETLGSFFQIIVIVVVVVGSAVVATSGTARSRLRNFIAQNFFSYRYDYRQEWLRFIATVAAGDGLANLRVRAIKAIADIVDSPGGAIWLVDDRSEELSAVDQWSTRVALGGVTLPAAACAELLAKGEPVDAHRFLATIAEPSQAVTAALQSFWLLVPLSHRAVSGFVALQPPRAPRELGWEDYDLLKTVGQQVASYLAEDAAVRQLVQARQLEDFNRRFAFVVHDLKNMTSQLQLLVRNADRHGDNPAFQKDLLATVRNAVEKMTRLLEQLSSKRLSEPIAAPGAAPGLDLDAVVRALCQRWPAGVVAVGDAKAPVQVRGDAEKLSAALSHVIQNGVEATGGRGPVAVRLARRGDNAAIEIEDHGHGMEASFIRDELFKPFRSTKSAGYGIGAFQARELVREMGGVLNVTSEPGKGTVVTIMLPALST
jgi:putative PEP-CTERM system histidine kinase